MIKLPFIKLYFYFKSIMIWGVFDVLFILYDGMVINIKLNMHVKNEKNKI